MSAIALEPSAYRQPETPCSWCGLRIGQHTLFGSPTCTDCKAGTRRDRVRAYTDKLRRAAGRQL